MDGATVGCPVDGVDNVVCPDVFIFFLEEVFPKLNRSIGMADGFWDGVSDDDVVD